MDEGSEERVKRETMETRWRREEEEVKAEEAEEDSLTWRCGLKLCSTRTVNEWMNSDSGHYWCNIAWLMLD